MNDNVLNTQENNQPEVYDDVGSAADALLSRWEDAAEQPSDQAPEEATDIEVEEAYEPDDQETDELDETELDEEDTEIDPEDEEEEAEEENDTEEVEELSDDTLIDILVDGETGLAQRFFGCFTGQTLVAQIDQHQVVVCASGDQMIVPLNECTCHGLGILLHLQYVFHKAVLQGLAESHSLGRDHVFHRSALSTRKNCSVEQGRHTLHLSFRCFKTKWILKVLAHHDESTPGSSQGLVGRGCDHMAVRQGIVQHPFGDQPRRMADVGHEQCTHRIGNRTETHIIDISGVSGGTTNDQIGTFVFGPLLYLIIVEKPC